MKEWFDNLESRERLYVIAGVFILSALLLYFLLWSPLASKTQQLRSAVTQQQDDLRWMQAAEGQIKKLRRANPTAGRRNRSLMSLVDQNVNQAGLKTSLQRMEPDGSDTFKLWFSQTAFDSLINMLGQLEQQQGVSVKTISLTPAKDPGLVDARVTISRGG